MELEPYYHKTVDDIIYQCQHEIDMCDEDQDGAPIKTSKQRAKVLKFIELCIKHGGTRIQD